METKRPLCSPPSEREQLFIHLYKKAFPVVCKYISKRGGNMEQAKDVFQEALLLYYEKVVVGRTEIASNETAYLVGISKHLWFQLCTKEKGTCELGHHDLAAIEDEKLSDNKLLALLETSGKKCMDMLKAFYYDKLNMVQVAENFGYNSERSATVQKYKCLENIRNTVNQKQLQYEDFLA